MFGVKKSVYSIFDGKTVIRDVGAILYLADGKVGLQLFQDNQHKLIVVEVPVFSFKEIDHPHVERENAKNYKLVRHEYVINPEDTLASVSLEIINASSSFSQRWGFFSKLYTRNEISQVLAFVNSLTGITSYNNFNDFIEEKARENNLSEVIQGIDAQKQLLMQKPSCAIL